MSIMLMQNLPTRGGSTAESCRWPVKFILHKSWAESGERDGAEDSVAAVPGAEIRGELAYISGCWYLFTNDLNGSTPSGGGRELAKYTTFKYSWAISGAGCLEHFTPFDYYKSAYLFGGSKTEAPSGGKRYPSLVVFSKAQAMASGTRVLFTHENGTVYPGVVYRHAGATYLVQDVMKGSEPWSDHVAWKAYGKYCWKLGIDNTVIGITADSAAVAETDDDDDEDEDKNYDKGDIEAMQACGCTVCKERLSRIHMGVTPGLLTQEDILRMTFFDTDVLDQLGFVTDLMGGSTPPPKAIAKGDHVKVDVRMANPLDFLPKKGRSLRF